MTNFSIFKAESRLYWVQEGYLSARSQGCAEGPGGAWSGPGGRRTVVWVLVGPGNTNVAMLGGYWVGGGVVPTQYPVYPTRRTPLYRTHAVHHAASSAVRTAV